MKSYSQAGQDVFVRLVLGRDKPGTFLDIGCAGEQYSNTLALQEEGWSGHLVDIDMQTILNATDKRKGNGMTFTFGDAKEIPWAAHSLPPSIDYLSLDVDESSLGALKNLPLEKTRFGVITIEHDAYRFGDKLRDGERAILSAFGYHLICRDVCATGGNPFEDWWVDTKHAQAALHFTSLKSEVYTKIFLNAGWNLAVHKLAVPE